jgi:hypothetical protein
VPACSLRGADVAGKPLVARWRPPHAPKAGRVRLRLSVQARTGKENRMRMVIAAVAAMIISAAIADELGDARRLAVAGRDSYWKCLAREYSRDSNKGMSGQDFASPPASVCASERQNFRVALMDYLSMQSPGPDAGHAVADYCDRTFPRRGGVGRIGQHRRLDPDCARVAAAVRSRARTHKSGSVIAARLMSASLRKRLNCCVATK